MFYRKHEGDLIYKPLKKGRIVRGNEQGLIFTNFVEPGLLDEFDKIKFAPCLLQKYIHKSLELRVTVIGQIVFAVEIQSQQTPGSIHDWRRVQENLPHKLFHLPADLENKCRNLVKELGLQFGALDLIITPNNEYVFVEINPNGQWAWIQQLCPEIPLRESLADLLIDS